MNQESRMEKRDCRARSARPYCILFNHDSKFLIRDSTQKGQAVITAVVFFLLISVIASIGVINPVLRQVKQTDDFARARASLYVSQAVNEDAIYRLKSGKNFVSPSTITLNGCIASASTTAVADGLLVNSSGNALNLIKNIQTHLTSNTAVSFDYGVQAGQGGFNLMGGARVNGNVYSNGSIIADSGVTITGTAIAANSSPLTADQTNNSPSTPPNSVTFGNASATQDFAQGFQVSTTDVVNKIRLYIKKVGSPSNVTVRIIEDNGGIPSGFEITNTTLSASLVTVNYSWVDVFFPAGQLLTAGTSYWLVIDGGNSSSNYYIIGANSGTYGNGTGKIGKYSGTWSDTTPSGLDGYFFVYIGGQQSTIGGGSWVGSVVIGSGSTGDAWAHTVKGAQVYGSLYCQTGSINNKNCNATRGDPSPQPFPVSQGNIDGWKDEAVAGGTYNGNYSVGWQGATLGPQKIVGNLSIAGGGTLTVTGTIWVTGSITLGGGGKIVLASSYGTKSGIIISDGIMNIGGGGNISGTGQSGSFVLMLTTSDCPDSPSCSGNSAISVNATLSGAVFVAQSGTIHISGGTNLKEATAYQVIADGGATLTYDTGLANMYFKSASSGGYVMDKWKEQ